MSVTVKRYGNPITGANNGIKEGNLELAVNVTAQAKALAPVDLGQLRNSIMYKTGAGEGGFNDGAGEQASDKITPTPTETTGYVGANLVYAPYQEFGTKKMAPKPYLRPAIAIVVKGQDTLKVLAKIEKEQMNGALKGIKSLSVFREKF